MALRVDTQILGVLPEVEGRRVKVFGDAVGSSLGRDRCEPVCSRSFRPALRLHRSAHEPTTKTVENYENGQRL